MIGISASSKNSASLPIFLEARGLEFLVFRATCSSKSRGGCKYVRPGLSVRYVRTDTSGNDLVAAPPLARQPRIFQIEHHSRREAAKESERFERSAREYACTANEAGRCAEPNERWDREKRGPVPNAERNAASGGAEQGERWARENMRAEQEERWARETGGAEQEERWARENMRAEQEERWARETGGAEQEERWARENMRENPAPIANGAPASA
jgi:hypothetical protein